MNLEDFPEVPAHVRMIVWLGLEKHQEAWSNREQTEGDFCVYAETVNTTDSRRILGINNHRSKMGPDSRIVIFFSFSGGGGGEVEESCVADFTPESGLTHVWLTLGFQTTESRFLILITRHLTSCLNLVRHWGFEI